MKPDWHGVRTAGRVERQLDVLHQVAHAISTDEERTDRPGNGDEAHARLSSLLRDLQETASRIGLGAADGHFTDHVAGVAERYGRNLFHCFDDDRIPSTTNGLEGFFGATKSQLRHALGTSSTTNGVARNLGADYLLAFAHSRATSRDDLLGSVAHLEPAQYDSARARLSDAEEPARLRRSRRRFPKRHLERLLAQWQAGPGV